MEPIHGETAFPDFITYDATGAPVDADSAPTCEVYEDGDAAALAYAPTVTQRGSLPGQYYASVELTSGNGFDVGKTYSIYAVATVDTIATKTKIANFVLREYSNDTLASLINTLIGTPATDVSADIAAVQAMVDLLDDPLEVNANVTQWLGTAVVADTAGIPNVNTVTIENAGAGSVIASQVWDSATGSYAIPGSFGAAVAAAGNPWDLAAADNNTAGTMGELLNLLDNPLDVNVTAWLGTAVNASTAGYPDVNTVAFANTTIGSTPDVNVQQWLGNAVTATTAGLPDVNVYNWNNAAAQGSGNPDANVTGWLGTAVTAAVAGVPDINVIQWLGTAVTAVSAGVPDVNVVAIDNVSPVTTIEDAVWDAALTSHSSIGSFGEAVAAAGNPWSSVAADNNTVGTMGELLNLLYDPLNVNVASWLGTAVTAATAGVPDVNVLNWGNGAAQGSGNPDVNVTGWLGTAVTAATAGVPDVNVYNWNNIGAQGSSGLPDVVVVSTVTDAITADSIAASAVEELVNGVWDATLTNYIIPGSTGDTLANLSVDADDIQTRLPAALVSGRMDVSVGAYQSGQAPLQPTTAGRTLDVDTAGSAEANVTLWRGSQPGNIDGNGFLPSNLAAINGNTTRATTLATAMDNDRLDVKVSTLATASALTSAASNVTAVKAKTDQLTFTVANQVDANALTGGGSSAADVADAVWDEAVSAHITAGSFGARAQSVTSFVTTIASLTSQTLFTLTDGPPDDDALNCMVLLIRDASNAAQFTIGAVRDYTASSKTVAFTTSSSPFGPKFTIAVGDSVTVLGVMPLVSTLHGYSLDVTSNGNAGIDWSNVENATNNTTLSNTTVAIVSNTSSVSNPVAVSVIGPNVITAASLATDAGTEIATAVRTNLATELGYLTGDAFARLGAPVGASLSADIAAVKSAVDTVDDLLDTEVAAIKVDTAAILEDTGSTGVLFADAEDVYPADIQFTRNLNTEIDEYTVVWYRNGAVVTSGITSPTIMVTKRSDGTSLVAETAMTQIGSTGSYKYDEAEDFVVAGRAYLVTATAVINGSERVWVKVIGRDSTAS